MATFADLKIHHRLFTENYPFGRYAVTDNPCATLRKPLSECRVALVTTAGLRHESDRPFNNRLGLGDTSFREISSDVEAAALIEDHSSSSFDHSGVQADRNIAFPLDRFRELEEEGVIGSLNHRHFSFMGSIISASGLIEDSAPETANRLSADGVDAVLLVPI